MKNNKLFAIGLAATIAIGGCTNLDVEEKDSSVVVSGDGTFTGVPPAATLTSAYADLRDFAAQDNLYALLEVTSDELLVPTRGTDWGDNGIWRSLRQHTWDAQHQYILTSWNQLNRNVYKINTLLAEVSKPNAQQIAEGKFLRAFSMWYVLDLFRQVPYRNVTDPNSVNPQVLTPQETIDFIVKDLTEALPTLPATAPKGSTRFASKAAANFLLAKLYLNKHVYLNTAVAPADMTKVVEYVDAITANGFALNDDFFEIFKNSSNMETIFWTDASYGNRIWNSLHYNNRVKDNTGGGWNGFSTTAEFYALFEGDGASNEPGKNQEERRGFVINEEDHHLDGIGYGFLVGQQYDSMGGLLKNRQGGPLLFTKEFASTSSLTGNNEGNGIRVLKYHPSNGSYGSYYILARYGDAYLMKIEAILRGGVSSDNPTTLFNNLRTKRSASTKATVTLDDVLDERARELYIEGWRRNDQVRFGTFTQKFAFMDNTEEHRKIFPIPANALSTNPNLKPNPGYGGE
jgi:hypothetical protein